MQTTNPHVMPAVTPLPDPARVPTVPTTLTRGLSVAVLCTTLFVALVSAVLELVCRRPDWTPGFVAAGVIGLLGAGVAIAVLSQAAGRSVDWLVTLTMAATTARMGVCGIGLLVATKLLNTPAEPTGFMICGYYAALLIVETTLLARATRGPAATAVGGTHA